MLTTRTFIALFVVLFASQCWAQTGKSLEGRVAPNQILDDISKLHPRTRVIINGGQFVAYVEDDGSFSFPNLPLGSHLLEVISNEYYFDKIRLDVTSAAVVPSITLPGTSWSKHGPYLRQPLELTAKAKLNYFVPREGFNILSLFSNPMMLMTGFSLLMFFVMPKMMANIDPEAMKEMQQQQANQPRPEMPEMPDVSQMMANWFAPAQQQQGGGSPTSRRRG
ncbi:hypothetical protein HK102_002246 [Quaeritorhiza haematococci]|nr:hypothetical protein HK102_002246 [Quaeritorhiza haematococci]